MNKLQALTMSQLLEVLSNRELGDIVVTVANDEEEVLVDVKLRSFGISFWIYDHGASILGAHLDDRYELVAFDNLEELRVVHLSQVVALLGELRK